MEPGSDAEVQAGQILAGKFRVERVLGRGGMGVVVLATHLQLDELVALKFLLPEALAHDEAVRRFEREARAAVKIKSEHVARVTDVGVLPSGSPYMVMEYLRGMDLAQYLEQNGALSYEEATSYLLQAMEAIAEAHSLGIVHRDLKPGNLFRVIRPDGEPSIKVLDFGISKITLGDHSMTRTSSMMGSPYYMSPEQMTNAKSVDARADVWALGVILHELLTGRVPYQGETIPEICAQVLQEAPPRLTLLRSGAPLALEAAIARALAKRREDRFGNVAQLARAISDFAPASAQASVERIHRLLGEAGSPARGSAVDPKELRSSDAERARAATAETLQGAAHTQPEWLPKRGGISPVWLGLSALVLLLGVGGAVVLSRGGASEESKETATAPAASLAEPPGAPEAAAPTQQAPTREPAKEAPAEMPKEAAPAVAEKAPDVKKTPAISRVTRSTQSPREPSSPPPPATGPAKPPSRPASDLLLDRK